MIDIPNAYATQLAASLFMLNDCIVKCPEDQWDTMVVKYPYWQVCYHALCFGDLYSSPGKEAWTPQSGPEGFHPMGWAEMDDEYPSRRFTQPELAKYSAYVFETAPARVRTETMESLAGPSGFPWLPTITRAELHPYSARHVQHHVGQLSMILRRVGVVVPWSKQGLAVKPTV